MPTLADLIPLRLALETFLTAKQAARCTPRTLQHYRWTLDRFCVWLEAAGIVAPDHITAHHWRAYLVHLDEQGLSANSVRDAARITKTWLRWLHHDGIIAVDFTPRLALPQPDEVLLPAFTPEEVKRLLQQVRNDRDRAIVLVLLDTGLRVSELCALNVADFDVTTGALTVHQGKGRKDRVVYLGAKAKRALLKHLAARPAAAPLFTAPTNDRFTVDGVQSMLARLGQRARVEHCHPHTFRRTFALWSLRAGMNIYALQRLMGHADLAMLRRYLALLEQDLATAHREHSAVDTQLR